MKVFFHAEFRYGSENLNCNLKKIDLLKIEQPIMWNMYIERLNVFLSIPLTGMLGTMLYNIVNEIDQSKAIQKVPALRDLMQTLTGQVCRIQLNLSSMVKLISDRPGATFYTEWPLVYQIFQGTRGHFQLIRG